MIETNRETKKTKETKQGKRLLSFNKIDQGCVLDYTKQKGIYNSGCLE